MTHRAETILQTITTTLTGLTTTGANVTRARAYNLAALPALTIAKGADQVIEDWVMGGIGRKLQIEITAHAQATDNLETRLNQIATEVYAALTANTTQGLIYVYETELKSDNAPQIESELSQPTGQMSMTWEIEYEHHESSTEIGP